MQHRTQKWVKLAASNRFNMDARAVINGKEYFRISAPEISRSLATEPLSVGNCNSASLRLTVLLEEGESIPESAAVRIIGRLTDLDNTTHTEVLPFGEYWVDNGVKNENLYEMTCYDAMLKTSQPMVDDTDNSDDWPKTMEAVVQEIAYRIGVPIDPRTCVKHGVDYMIPFPKGYTMQQVLGWIGGCNGGNWTITEAGMLRLIPVAPPKSESTGMTSLIRQTYPVVDHDFNPITTADGYNVVYDLTGTIKASTGGYHISVVRGKLTTGKTIVVSGVQMQDDSGNTFACGDDSGYVVKILGNPYSCQKICTDLFGDLEGLTYSPFTATDALADPAIELGDRITISSDVDSTAYAMDITLGVGYSVTVSAPTNAEATRQYPYLTGRDKNRDKEFLEANATYNGVQLSDSEGLLVTKSSTVSSQSLARSEKVNRAEVQYSDQCFAMRARNADTGAMDDCIYYDDSAEAYRITRAVKLDQVDDLSDKIDVLTGAEGVTLPQIQQLLADIQSTVAQILTIVNEIKGG